MIASPIETGIGIAIILTGVPVYFVFVAWKNKPMWVQKLSEGFTKFMQKMFVVLPPNKPSPSTNEIKSAEKKKLISKERQKKFGENSYLILVLKKQKKK